MQKKDVGPLGEYLQRRRQQLGWEVKQIAHRARMAASYVSRIERGTRGGRPPMGTIEKLARGYDVSVEDIERAIRGGVALPVPPLSPEELLERYRMVAPVAIPVIEHPAHAGHAGSAVIDYVYVERAYAVNRDLVCIPIEGPCMLPLIAPGDRVIVDRALQPEQGQVVIAVIEEEIFVRRFYVTAEQIVLRADNTEYPDIQAEEAQIVGVVLEIRKRPTIAP